MISLVFIFILVVVFVITIVVLDIIFLSSSLLSHNHHFSTHHRWRSDFGCCCHCCCYYCFVVVHGYLELCFLIWLWLQFSNCNCLQSELIWLWLHIYNLRWINALNFNKKNKTIISEVFKSKKQFHLRRYFSLNILIQHVHVWSSFQRKTVFIKTNVSTQSTSSQTIMMAEHDRIFCT